MPAEAVLGGLAIVIVLLFGVYYFVWGPFERFRSRRKNDKETARVIPGRIDPALYNNPPPPPAPASVRVDYGSRDNEAFLNLVELVSNLNGTVKTMSATLDKIPSKTLNTIQGSVNTTSGKLGELIQYLKLQSTYDRFIITNDICDFIGIRFGREGVEPAIDFIDVKTGNAARLNPDQKKLRAIISEKKNCINFVVVKTEIT